MAAALLAGGLCAAGIAPAATGPGAELPGRPGESGVGVWFGAGWYRNRALNDSLAVRGIPEITSGFEYGLLYRRRVAPWLSLGLELMRMDGRADVPNQTTEYSISGSPLVVDAHLHPVRLRSMELELFGGAGLLVGGTIRIDTPGGYAEAKKAGFYFHGGAEGVVRLGPSLGFAVRGLVRRAQVNDVDLRPYFTAPSTQLYDLDFSGTAVHFGPRWYFGGSAPADPGR